MKRETNDEAKARLAKWRKNRQKLFADTKAALKEHKFVCCEFETVGGENEHFNTEVTLGRDKIVRKLRITVECLHERSSAWRSTPTEHVSVKVDCVSPRRTLVPTNRYVQGEKIWTPVKGESLAKVLLKAYEEALREEAEKLAHETEKERLTKIAANVNFAAGYKVCRVHKNGWGINAKLSLEMQLRPLSEGQMIRVIAALKAHGELNALQVYQD